ncbi:MAG: hypothetical protein WB626_08560 [Bacteroidota bacterium]
MRIFITATLGVVLCLVLAGCGSGPKTLQGTDACPPPEWFTKIPADPNFLYAAKSAVSTDMQLAIDKAANDGRADIAFQMEVKVKAYEARVREEVGTGEGAQYLELFTTGNKQVTARVLVGSKTKEQTYCRDGNNWRSYVLMELPLGEMQAAVLQQTKRNEQMYTRFRATQVFKELEDEVQKYEEWKRQQEQQQP